MSDPVKLGAAAQIASAYLGYNQVPVAGVPEFIRTVYNTVAGLGGAAPVEERKDPAVPVKKSIGDDFIICLEDGKKLKMLKRYLRTKYNLSPEQYRAKWNLPGDYPLVAPDYARKRSEHAKRIGLGRVPEGAKRPPRGKK